jgi:hypothetical protein
MTAQVPIYNLRSGTASKRPAASGLAFGQIAINYNHSDPAIYLRGSSDDLVKVAPVFVGSGAPNATPASGGASGNTVGEQWLDITNGDYVTKVWDGTAWRSPVITSALIKNGTIVDEDINASAGIAVTKLGNGALPTGITIASDNIVNGTIVNADINAAAAIALSKLDTGALPSGITVNSDNIVNGSIVNADINASAAIGLSKLATGALPTGITVTSGNVADSSILKSGDLGVSVQAYDVDTAKLDVAQSFTAQQTFKELKETVFTLGTTGSISLDPANGSIQTSVLTGAPAFTDALESGQSLVLRLEGGASFSVTWPTITWVSTSGNVAPTLTAKDVLVFWKISTTLYGAYVGSYV